MEVRDAEGRAVDEAQIAIDGIYEIEGVRFNMGGWWEFRLAITGPRGVRHCHL